MYKSLATAKRIAKQRAAIMGQRYYVLNIGGKYSVSTVDSAGYYKVEASYDATPAAKFVGMTTVDGEQFAHYTGVIL